MINPDVRYATPDVKAVFDGFPPRASARLLDIRALIFQIAKESDNIGDIEETLKWGEPSYLTQRPKSGTTIRLGWKDKHPDHVSLFVNCKTSMVEDWRHMFGQTVELIGNRELRMPLNASLPLAELKQCIFLALTYHVRKAA